MDKNFSDILNTFRQLNEGRGEPDGDQYEERKIERERERKEQSARLAGKSPAERAADARKQDKEDSWGQWDESEHDDHAPGECATCDKRRDEEAKQKRKDAKAAQTKTDEGSMSAAEKHASGSKFGGYWQGTNKNTPDSGMSVGALEESLMTDWKQFKDLGEGLEDVVKGVKRWAKDKPHKDVVAAKHMGRAIGHYNQGNMAKGDKESQRYTKIRDFKKVKEDGAITATGSTPAVGTQGTTPVAPNPAQIAQDANKIKQGLTGKLPPGVDASKISTALATAADTGKPLAGNQAQAVTNTLAPTLAKIAQNPAQANQLGQLIKKAGK